MKLRGVPDSQVINQDLHTNITTWLTSLMCLEGNVFPTIASMYRIGAMSAARPNLPRDIIMQFVYAKERDALLRPHEGIRLLILQRIESLARLTTGNSFEDTKDTKFF